MKHYIGIDLGGTIIKIGLVSNGKVLSSANLPADSRNGITSRLTAIEETIRNLVGDKPIDGIALAFPGVVNFARKRAAATNAKYDDAPEIDLESWAKEKFGVPFAMDNDSRMAMIGEWRYGVGKGYDNMVMMTIGTGIGTGTVVDGRPLYGSNFSAGAQGGHIIIDYKGRTCTCGNRGCVEAHASSFFLPEIITEDERLSPTFRQDPANRDFKTLFDKYRAYDPDARMVVEGCMDVWAAGIVNYIHAYSPGIVVIGGGIMKSADIILPYVRAKVESLAWQPMVQAKIVATQLGDSAALVAADYYFE